MEGKNGTRDHRVRWNKGGSPSNNELKRVSKCVNPFLNVKAKARHLTQTDSIEMRPPHPPPLPGGEREGVRGGKERKYGNVSS